MIRNRRRWLRLSRLLLSLLLLLLLLLEQLLLPLQFLKQLFGRLRTLLSRGSLLRCGGRVRSILILLLGWIVAFFRFRLGLYFFSIRCGLGLRVRRWHDLRGLRHARILLWRRLICDSSTRPRRRLRPVRGL